MPHEVERPHLTASYFSFGDILTTTLRSDTAHHINNLMASVWTESFEVMFGRIGSWVLLVISLIAGVVL